MIEFFVGGFILCLCAIKDKIEKKDRIEPEEYHPYMYDHFNDDCDNAVNHSVTKIDNQEI